MKLPAWKNPPVLNAPFLVLETFAASPVHFLGWPLVLFSQNFMWISVFFDYHTALKDAPNYLKSFEKELWITVLKAKILFASTSKFYTFSAHLSRKQCEIQNQKCACCNKILQQLLITSLSSPHFIKLFFCNYVV